MVESTLELRLHKQIAAVMMLTEAQKSLMKLDPLPPELHFIRNHFVLFYFFFWYPLSKIGFLQNYSVLC